MSTTVWLLSLYTLVLVLQSLMVALVYGILTAQRHLAQGVQTLAAAQEQLAQGLMTVAVAQQTLTKELVRLSQDQTQEPRWPRRYPEQPHA